jgi:hypothetical protein
MKKMLNRLLCALVLITPVSVCSCEKISEPAHSDFRLDRTSCNLCGKPAQIRFNTKKTSDASSRAKVISNRYEKDMMRWADYSALDTTP